MNLVLLLVLFCSDPTNLSQCKINPSDTEIAISGNDSGSTCIGWTGKIGDKDVLEALGIQIEMSPDQLVESLEELNIAFLTNNFLTSVP